MTLHVACYLIGVPMLGQLRNNERAELIILLYLLALVAGILAPNVGFLFGTSCLVPTVFVAIAL